MLPKSLTAVFWLKVEMRRGGDVVDLDKLLDDLSIDISVQDDLFVIYLLEEDDLRGSDTKVIGFQLA